MGRCEVREAEDESLRAICMRSVGFILKAIMTKSNINKIKKQMPSLETIFKSEIMELLP